MTKKEILEALAEAGIEHDASARKADLLALLTGEEPAEPSGDPGKPLPPVPEGYVRVRRPVVEETGRDYRHVSAGDYEANPDAYERYE